MQPYAVGGMILIVLGLLALSVHSVTYFTSDTVVGPLGFFAWDVQRPHTLIINPIAGILAIALGAALMFLGPKRSAA